MRLSLPDLEPGADYYVQVRASDSGIVSEWSQLYTITVTGDVLSPATPTGLTWIVDGTAFLATWVAPTTNTDGSALKDFKDYQVTIYSPANTAEKAIYYTTSTRFDLPFEINASAFSVPRAQVTIEVRARDNSGNMAGIASATTANPAPSTVTGLVVTGGTGSINCSWTPVTDADLKNYEVYTSLSAAFVPGPANLASVSPANTFSFAATPGATWYVKVRAADIFGTFSVAYPSAFATAKVATDGIAPTASPPPTVISGIGSLFVRWTPIVNADLVKYEVHVSPTTGFTPGPTTLVGTTAASLMTVNALPGPVPAPGAPDTRVLQYGTNYFVKIIAKDDDGMAAASTEAFGVTAQVTGPDIAAGAVTADHVAARTFTGDEFAGTMFIGNTFKTAETGQRAEFGVDGYKAFKSNGDKKFWVTTDDSDSYLDGEFVARSLTVTGGASFQSNQNEVTATSALTLRRGVTSPTIAPQLSMTYDKMRPDTTGVPKDSSGLGLFDIAPAAVTHIRWVPAGSYWIFYHSRPDGTRLWYINPDGTPRNIATQAGVLQFYDDFFYWQMWSSVEITTGAKAALYTAARYTAYGAPNDWYVTATRPAGGGVNSYTRLSTGVPALGSNGTDLFVAEVVGSSLKINYHNFDFSANATSLPAPFTSHSSSQGYSDSLCHIEYNSTATGGFDISGGVTHRYATALRGTTNWARTIYQSGAGPNNLFPGSSGGWASSTVQAESWEPPPGTTRRGQGWDGSAFWTYCADGYMYKHTNNQWDISTQSNKWWAKSTFYDSKSLGTGTHETLPGASRSIIMNRRAKLAVTLPTVPVGLSGDDDPDMGRLYMGRGTAQPTDANFRWQYEGAGTTTILTGLAVALPSPPSTNNFPVVTPARIRNDDDSLIISGDGSMLAKSVYWTDSRPMLIAHLDANSAGFPNGAWSTFSALTNDVMVGMTYSAGSYTVSRAGWYAISFGIGWSVSSTGQRGARALVDGASSFAPTVSAVSAVGTTPTFAQFSTYYEERFVPAGGVIRLQGFQNNTSATPGLMVMGDPAGGYTKATIRWIGP